MNVCFITFRSVTLAQRGEKVLKKKNIRCQLQRTPRWMEEQGCGYCLKMGCQEMPAAVEMLRDQNIDFRKVYRQQTGGNVEEVAL